METTATERRDQRGRLEHWESRLVWDFFKNSRQGFFVEVGANHPTLHSQTWFLEQQGWRGVLIEPNPQLCRELREHRPNSRVVEGAVCAPQDVGELTLHIAQGLHAGQSAIRTDSGGNSPGTSVKVAALTLDSALEKSEVKSVDFVSMDIEGMELDALQGFDLARWKPSLILIEDFFESYDKHRYLKSRGYKLIRRTGYNNWYAPQNSPATLWSASTSHELFRLARKFWLNPPYAKLRSGLKRR